MKFDFSEEEIDLMLSAVCLYKKQINDCYLHNLGFLSDAKSGKIMVDDEDLSACEIMVHKDINRIQMLESVYNKLFACLYES